MAGSDGKRPAHLGGEGEEEGADDFEDIVDSPHGVHLHAAQVGCADDTGSCVDEDFVIEQRGSEEETAFDSTVCALQDLVMSDEFQDLLQGFSKEHCGQFEDTDENKLVYTEIFKKYSDLIEGYLEKKLKEAVPGFEMAKFLEELTKRGEDELDNSMFDLLASLGDFDTFKQQMLSAKAPEKSLTIAGVASTIHPDEDEEGEARPDLDDLLVVTSPKAKGK
mmetsp:Transcript_81521/g.242984  ORF Transcript_81521/g.242984 Transcript_81521/m.242984 type:complete len:221 (+) Transcript_81521:68-730(+)|eukprot:CAMPEP_0175232714 /NCGR_PEP_ID=MMETSP0093-20121207/26103_1 /TAXON_ID=311494 /ORGANISM="Alexandrium monilatum, Strain CCMP3105" /LENGTH=220 /DNA_ID=CAMNT_0016526583 /DNA_START=43 /DNA_END=705 /DNA_ORIENTATION=+